MLHMCRINTHKTQLYTFSLRDEKMYSGRMPNLVIYRLDKSIFVYGI